MWKHDEEGDGESAGIEIERQSDVAMTKFPAGGADNGSVGMLVGYAQHLVRDPAKLIVQAKHVGALLAKVAFYRFPMAGKTIEGPSIKLAQALVQEWGGIAYTVRVLHVENLASGGRRIHLRASVIDLKTLVAAEIDQVASTLAPPGKFGTDEEQRDRWHSMQTQSAASKVVRNAILRVLPAWFVDAGMRAASDADAKSALLGKPLPEARIEAVEHYKTVFGISQQELEAHFGLVMDLWAVPQISDLMTLSHDIDQGRMPIAQFRANLAPKTEKTASGGREALGLKSRPASPDATAKTDAAKPDATPADAVDEKTRREQEAFERSQNRTKSTPKDQAGLNLATPNGGGQR